MDPSDKRDDNRSGYRQGVVYVEPKRINLMDRVDMRLDGLILIRKQWPNQYFNGVMVADPAVVVEWGFEGWEVDKLTLMDTPITYMAMFKGKKDLFEYSLGATPVKPTLEVARDLLLPVVTALKGYVPHNRTQVLSRDVTLNRH